MKQKKQSKNYTAPALDKGLDILELLSENKEGLTQAEIANRLNKSVNEIYRMISTLRNREYVDFDQDEDRYNLSYKILNMTAKFEPVKTLINLVFFKLLYTFCASEILGIPVYIISIQIYSNKFLILFV